MQKADMLTEITSRLEAAGLRVKEPYGAYERDTDLMVSGVIPIDPQVDQRYNGCSVTIGYQGNLWCFKHRENIPGPGDETVEHYVSTVEEIVDVTLNFYFGEAQTIEGWLVPTHRYPEWDVARLHQAIEQARSPSRREWYVIDHSYLNRYTQLVQEFCLPSSPRTKRNTWSGREWCACMFVTLEHEDPSLPLLWMRRDAVVAYLVKEICPACDQPTLVRTSAPVHMWPRPWGGPIYTCQTCGQRSHRDGSTLRLDSSQEL